MGISLLWVRDTFIHCGQLPEKKYLEYNSGIVLIECAGAYNDSQHTESIKYFSNIRKLAR